MANLVCLDQGREMLSLRDAMDRLFEDSFTPSRRQNNQGDGAERTWRLPLDAYVTAEEIVVVANMPGVKPEQVEITLEGDTLTIRGERPRPIENVDYVMHERPFGKFQRTLNINIPVDANRAEAQYDDGLLTLVIPKAEGAQPKIIQVGTKQAQPTA